MTERVRSVRLSYIETGLNARQNFDPVALRELADSIAENGLLQPITLRSTSVKNRFQLIAGERRLRAVQLLEWDRIPAIVREMTDEQAQSLMLLENIQRQPFSPVEEASGFRDYMTAFESTETDMAEKIGRTVEFVRRRLSLLQLCDNVREMVDKGHFPVGHAEVMTCLDINRQNIAFRLYRDSNHMPLHVFKRAVADLHEQQMNESAIALFDVESYWAEQAQAMDIPRRGKKAVVYVPRRTDIPDIEIVTTDSAADVMARYIQRLVDTGHTNEAGAIGTLLETLVKSSWMNSPTIEVSY